MIKTHSDDPDIAAAAAAAHEAIERTLRLLPPAETFDYGGHILHVSDYSLCTRCTRPIAEAQQAHAALVAVASETADGTVREHIELAAQLLLLEANTAAIRAELHNGHHSEPIVNSLLGFIYDRHIGDQYGHAHQQAPGAAL